MRLDRRLYSPVSFPADYGFVAGTERDHGEPLDALVRLEDPTFPGCWVRARVVGVFWIRYDKEGESRREAKIITVAEGDPNFEEVPDLDQLPEHLLAAPRRIDVPGWRCRLDAERDHKRHRCWMFAHGPARERIGR
jgi:inorganic pyrophosphatase